MLSERPISDPVVAPTLRESDWGYGRLLNVLLRRKWWVISIFLGCLSAAILITLRTKPTYLSSMQFLIEPNYKGRVQVNGNVTTTTEISDPQVQVDLNTQIRVLQSTELLQKAVDRFNRENPKSSKGAELTLEDLKTRLAISPIYGSDASNKKVRTNLMAVSYLDDNEAKTQRFLQTLWPIYQAYNLEQQKLRLAKGLAFINGQLPGTRQSVLESEAALQQFRRGNQIIDPSEQSKTAAATLDTIRQQREALKADISEAAANFQSVQQRLAKSPKTAVASAQLTQSNLYQSRLQAMQKLDLELERLRQQYTEEHPAIQDLVKQRREQQGSLQQEAVNVLGGSSSVPRGSQSLVSSGQLGDNGVALAKQLTDAQNLLSSLQAKDISLAKTERQLSQELQKYPALIAEYERIQPEVQLRRNALQKLLDAKQDLSLEIARGGYSWEVVEPPREGEQISPSIVKNVLLGIVVGLFLGAVAAFIRDALDDTIRTAEQLDEGNPFPLLGALPWRATSLPSVSMYMFPANGVISGKVLENLELYKWLPLQNALDEIYGNIQYRHAQQPHQVLMVTSALPGEGKSTLSLGLALSAARRDQRVLLIDADLRDATLHKTLELDNAEGLSTLLTGDSEVKPQWFYVRRDDEDAPIVFPSSQTRAMPPPDVNLDILTAGPAYGDPVKLLQFERLQEILTTFREEYDLIIIDSPPVLGMADALQIGFGCDGVVMVARAEQITQSDLIAALSSLNKFNVLGCVMNGLSQTPRYYGRTTVAALR
jgi:polysaccharide biosynthesis transport protein